MQPDRVRIPDPFIGNFSWLSLPLRLRDYLDALALERYGFMRLIGDGNREPEFGENATGTIYFKEFQLLNPGMYARNGKWSKAHLHSLVWTGRCWWLIRALIRTLPWVAVLITIINFNA